MNEKLKSVPLSEQENTVLNIIADTIREVGAPVPNGVLYMTMQSIIGPAWNIQAHTFAIGRLCADGRLVNNDHLLSVP